MSELEDLRTKLRHARVRRDYHLDKAIRLRKQGALAEAQAHRSLGRQYDLVIRRWGGHG